MSFEKGNDFKGLGFEPNQKELDMFTKEKMDMYKGTFFVCLMYGLTALGLLIVIFFTEWGREYIYKKMMPAAITFIIGSVFIILYLVISIYDLKPRKLGNKMEKDNEIICPDYWKLKLVSDAEKSDLVENNKLTDTNNGRLYDDIRTVKDETLKYKCVMDESVFSDLKSLSDKKNGLYDNKTQYYQNASKYVNRGTSSVDYLYIVKKDTTTPANTNANGTYNDNDISKYAQFSGVYRAGKEIKDTVITIGTGTTNNIQKNSLLPSASGVTADNNFYFNKNPLICNVVYPQVLAKLDKDTPEQNKYRCAYAKACDIPWTGLGCEPTKST